MNQKTRKCANCNNKVSERGIEIVETTNKIPFCDWNCVYDYVRNPQNFGG